MSFGSSFKKLVRGWTIRVPVPGDLAVEDEGQHITSRSEISDLFRDELRPVAVDQPKLGNSVEKPDA